MGSERVGITTTGCEGKIATDNSVENVLNSLTSRERQVLGLMAQGFLNKTIAEKLAVNQKSVQKYIKDIFPKIGISTEDAAIDTRVRSVLLYQRNTPDFKNPVESYFDNWEIAPLSPRQKELVSLIGKGYSNTEIARQLNISLNVFSQYINTILGEKISVDKQAYSSRVVLALISQTSHLT